MSDPVVTPEPEEAEAKALRLARELNGMTLTAEVHADMTGVFEALQAKVVDIVRIGASLHFVVVLDD